LLNSGTHYKYCGRPWFLDVSCMLFLPLAQISSGTRWSRCFSNASRAWSKGVPPNHPVVTDAHCSIETSMVTWWSRIWRNTHMDIWMIMARFYFLDIQLHIMTCMLSTKACL
jgi:hypothetical protein